MTCPACGAGQPAGHLCHDCTSRYEADLRLIAPHSAAEPPTAAGEGGGRQTLPWERQRRSWAGFDAELVLALARQEGRGPKAVVGRSSETPLVYSERASDHVRTLRSTLAGTIAAIWDERRDGAHWAGQLVQPHVSGMAAFLLDYVSRVRTHTQAADIVAAVHAAVHDAMAVIDAHGRADRHECPVCGQDQQAEQAVCPLCTEVVRASHVQRARLHDVLRDMLGLSVTRAQVGMWISRGQLTERRGLYSVKDAEALAVSQNKRGTPSSSDEAPSEKQGHPIST